MPELEEQELSVPHRFPARVINQTRGIPEGVETDEIYTFAAVISNQRLDSYFTKMADSSLRNYAADAAEGVALMNSHRRQELPIGYSFNAQLQQQGSPIEEYPRVLADFYTLRGLEVNDLKTDNFIKMLEAGIVRDVSIGFKEGAGFKYRCSICGKDMLRDYECRHYFGVEYEIIDNPEAEPDQQNVRKELAFAWVEEARLSEVSPVFDGSTPSAMVVKAERDIRSGKMDKETRTMLEKKYRMNFSNPKTSITVIEPAEAEADAESNERKAQDREEIMADEKTGLSEVRGVLTALKLDSGCATVLDGVNTLREEIERLQPFEAQAAEGRELRKVLVEDTLKEGVKAFGDKFDREGKTKLLENLDVASINELRSTWGEIGKQVVESAKRTSTDEVETETDEAYDDEELY